MVEFFRLFYGPRWIEFQERRTFKARVLGMVSPELDLDLLPTVKKNEVIKVPYE